MNHLNKKVASGWMQLQLKAKTIYLELIPNREYCISIFPR